MYTDSKNLIYSIQNCDKYDLNGRHLEHIWEGGGIRITYGRLARLIWETPGRHSYEIRETPWRHMGTPGSHTGDIGKRNYSKVEISDYESNNLFDISHDNCRLSSPFTKVMN